MRGAFRLIFLGAGGDVEKRAQDARAKWPAVREVAEIADFILADHKQPLALARRRGGADD